MDLNKVKQLIQEALAELGVEERESPKAGLLWGSKVSNVFKERVLWIADELGFNADWLMACIAFESAETFSPKIKNAAGSGAVGLIQFMPQTAIGLGTTVNDLALLSSEDQLKWVFKYFEPYRGRLHSLDDLYMAILWPAGVGKPEDYQLFKPGTTTYRQNAGLDKNKDGYVTKYEAAFKVREKLQRGEQFRG